MSKGVLLVQSAIEAQKSIIGSMRIDPELVGSVMSRLTDKDFIDETRTRAFIETGSWTDADRELMYHRAYRMMIRRCMTAANIKSARDNATEQFSKMMRALGVEKYEIRWEKDQ